MRINKLKTDNERMGYIKDLLKDIVVKGIHK